MEQVKIFESEYRFCSIVWDNEPINSTALAKLCKEELGWSKTTTYTVIRRLTDRGVVKSENAIVSAIISREEAEVAQIDELLTTRFGGSMPAFVAAFSKRQKLSEDKIARILRIIEDGEEA